MVSLLYCHLYHHGAKKLTSSIEQYNLALSYFLEDDLKLLGTEPLDNKCLNDWLLVDELDVLSSMMLLGLKTYIPDDIIVKVDRATMSVALEGREPFLDHRIVEWTSQLPVEFKYKNGVSKYLLRRALYKYIPKELVERPKQGFGVPIYEWFKKELRELYMEYLNVERIKKKGLFNHLEVKRLLEDFLSDRVVNHNKLWLLFVFEIWRERWM
jgi:asparagine synthase (glutamine-hydrolysing)